MNGGVPASASVYVMDDPRAGLRKVGFSMNIPERLRQLRLRPAHLRYVSEATAQAQRVEQLAHRLLELAGKRVRDELFSATVEECVAAIERAERIVCGLEPPPPQREKRPTKQFRFDPELLAELDAWLERRPYKTTRAAFIEVAVRELLASEKRKEKK